MQEHKKRRFDSDKAALIKLATAAATGDRLAAIAAVAGDRRSAERIPLTASADVVELGSGARFTTRTTDLGPGGCFIDMLAPIPVGARVSISVHRGDTRFETKGSVVYSQAGLGMGVAFDTLDAGQRAVLDAWLGELTGGRHVPSQDQIPEVVATQRGEEASDRVALVRLVQILMNKGILTDVEGRAIFQNLVI